MKLRYYDYIFTHSLQRSNLSKLNSYKKSDYLQTQQKFKLQPYISTQIHIVKIFKEHIKGLMKCWIEAPLACTCRIPLLSTPQPQLLLGLDDILLVVGFNYNLTYITLSFTWWIAYGLYVMDHNQIVVNVILTETDIIHIKINVYVQRNRNFG